MVLSLLMLLLYPWLPTLLPWELFAFIYRILKEAVSSADYLIEFRFLLEEPKFGEERLQFTAVCFSSDSTFDMARCSAWISSASWILLLTLVTPFELFLMASGPLSILVRFLYPVLLGLVMIISNLVSLIVSRSWLKTYKFN